MAPSSRVGGRQLRVEFRESGKLQWKVFSESRSIWGKIFGGFHRNVTHLEPPWGNPLRPNLSEPLDPCFS
jgi:hypothetical protein